jgi:hypothetical protein
MNAADLTRDQIFDLVTDKVFGASCHCKMWATLHNIVGHEMKSLRELELRGLLEDAGPILSLSSGAHQIAMTLSVCSLYERPGLKDCVTIQVYRDKVADAFEVTQKLDDRISSAYNTARRLYEIRTAYYAHSMAETCERDIFRDVGLSKNNVIELVDQTTQIVADLAQIEGRPAINLRLGDDVATRLAKVDSLLLKSIGLAD